jgi:uncharacterized membrane protein
MLYIIMYRCLWKTCLYMLYYILLLLCMLYIILYRCLWKSETSSSPNRSRAASIKADRCT